jgi:hypothetical protein
VNYYKLEHVQDALRVDYHAKRASAGPGPRVEVWSRSVGGEVFEVALAWEHGEEIVSEEEVLAVAEGLGIRPPITLVDNVKSRGGLHLGPTPPGRKA